MCDILVALPDATKSGKVIFGKNSDRPTGESQVLHHSPASVRRPSEPVICAYQRVPDEGSVLATLGCRPYWCWGYETGMNERGVVGGNTAVYTRSFWLKENRQVPGLNGMELLRFGLEKGTTAKEAVDVIITLLERYGQWGSAVQGLEQPQGCYENAFVLADYREAWMLETTGRDWAAKQIRTGVHALSNQLSIRNDWTLCSSSLESVLRKNGWWNPDEGAIDFAYCCSDHEHYPRQVSHIRWMRANQLLNDSCGGIDTVSMMSFLRDHYETSFIKGPFFHEFLPDFLTICMHDSPAGFTWGDTATSVIIEIRDDPLLTPLWCSYLPPCSSIYAGYFLGVPLPSMVANPGSAGLLSMPPFEAPRDSFSDSSLWWRMHRIVKSIPASHTDRKAELRTLFDAIEHSNYQKIDTLIKKRDGSYATFLESFAEQQHEKLVDTIEYIEKRWKIS